MNDCLIDIVAHRFDCGVRHSPALQSDMISIKISNSIALIFVAAPSYISVDPAPVGPDDLSQHRCISYRHTSSGVLHLGEFERNGEKPERSVPSTFITNDADLMRDTALSGLGICCLILDEAQRYLESGDLVEILPGWAPALPPNHLYFSNRRQPSGAFQASLDVMQAPQADDI